MHLQTGRVMSSSWENRWLSRFCLHCSGIRRFLCGKWRRFALFAYYSSPGLDCRQYLHQQLHFVTSSLERHGLQNVSRKPRTPCVIDRKVIAATSLTPSSICSLKGIRRVHCPCRRAPIIVG